MTKKRPFGILQVLDKIGWSTLIIQHNRRTGGIKLKAGKEWDDSFDWSKYGKKEGLPRFKHLLNLDTKAIKKTLNRYKAGAHLNRVIKLIKAGKHEKVEFLREPQQNIGFIMCIHSTTLGPPAGGIRRHEPDEPELEVLRDVLNLSRAMSFKDAAAGLPNGGSKLGIVSSAPTSKTPDNYYGFLAYGIDRSGSFTGPDMGFTLEDANRIRNYTRNIVGGTAKTGSQGATGKTAAWGVRLAMKEACQSKYGNSSLKGRTIAIQGLGQLGSVLGSMLLSDGARLIVADTSKTALKSFLARSKPKHIRVVAPKKIAKQKCNIFAPCAVGGIIDRNTVSQLRCEMIAGGANNPLKATSQQQELSLAEALYRKGIMFLPDWVVNAGGVIQGKEEHVYGSRFNLNRVRAKTKQACQIGTREILELSHKKGITPLRATYQKYEKIIY